MQAEGTALVTGASRGIGRALSLELAARGFDVVATMRDPDDGAALPDEAVARGGRLRVERLDLTRPDECPIPEGLRVVVSNAFYGPPFLPLEELTDDDWRMTFETNVFGPITLLRRAVPVMRRSGGGVICAVGSMALLAPIPFYGPYRASKGAMSALCETLRVELAPFGIRVVEALPGPIETDALETSTAVRPAQPADPAYHELAARQFEIDSGSRNVSVSAAAAAGAIVDAILDDDGPMRCGTDPLAQRSLENWRRMSDEEMADHILKRYRFY